MSHTGNFLLDQLPPSSQELLLNQSTHVELPSRIHLFRSLQTPAHVHFLTSGVVSCVINMREGGSSEVGMIGREGLVGTSALLGPGLTEAEAFMQVPGAGFRIPVAHARRAFLEDTEFRRLVLVHLQTQLNITAQLSACNKLHEAEARLARWLLMAADRARSETLNLTQEFLAQMLGSQRTTVALVAGILQRAGFIEYSRGTVHITDRPGLIQAACECYPITRQGISLD